jgi:hypothetical protein
MNIFGWLTALFHGIFGGKQDTQAGQGRPWWLDPTRRTKSRLKASSRYMRGGHGVRYTDAQNARRTRKQQKAASLRHLGRVA